MLCNALSPEHSTICTAQRDEGVATRLQWNRVEVGLKRALPFSTR